LLRRLLEGVAKQQTGDEAFTFSCVVVDNDELGSGRPVVDRFATECGMRLTYEIEPQRNFALVRNRTLSLAKGDFVAFIDDDEVPVPEWLANLLDTQKRSGADGVLGPVRPYFDDPPPRWILRGKLCERPVHPTGMVMDWAQSRTGNVLIKRTLFEQGGMRFDPAYATGGEDVDFFKRAAMAGYRFVWCEEAPAYELVPPERCRKSYFLKRALLLGQISLKHATDRLTPGVRIRIGLRSLLALLLYALALPVLMLGGFHLAMKYLIKACHHLGRLSALVGIKLMRARTF
jgi:glycosyltransferase involved in cell wall biosynthesis